MRHATLAALATVLTAAAASAQIQSHVLYEWPAGAEFIPNPVVFDPDTGAASGGVEIHDFTFEGEVVDTRIEITLENVPTDWMGLPLDASNIWMRIMLNGEDLVFPLIFQKYVNASGFDDEAGAVSFDFIGTGGPMTASVSGSGLNGGVNVNFWRIDWGSNEHREEPVNYGPVSGRVIIDYIPNEPACICELTGDQPTAIDVFDLLARGLLRGRQGRFSNISESPVAFTPAGRTISVK